MHPLIFSTLNPSRFKIPQLLLELKGNQAKRYLSQRPPKPSTFKPKPSKGSKSGSGTEEEAFHLTKLTFDAPLHLRKQALDMYEQCKLSQREPTTRFAIARQMRNLDLPPHRDLWQGINAKDELSLYRWINEAFGQLIYQKGLWKPSLDWGAEDDQAEAEQRAENLKWLQTAYEEQIVNPLKDRYGESEVTIALSKLPDDQKLYCEPSVIWQSVDPKTGQISLEWMSEFTADVAWPGLVSCQAHHDIARRYWEAEARQFAKSVGGIPRGMGENGAMLTPQSEEEKQLLSNSSSPSSSLHKPYEFNSSTLASSQANKLAAEAVLIKKFLQERNQSANPSRR